MTKSFASERSVEDAQKMLALFLQDYPEIEVHESYLSEGEKSSFYINAQFSAWLDMNVDTHYPIGSKVELVEDFTSNIVPQLNSNERWIVLDYDKDDPYYTYWVRDDSANYWWFSHSELKLVD